uniref:hypothetical protein n=1 Tax=Hassallia byssoidea TaxID=482630 RepID=UPI001913FACE|nr:hypothetical protein [Hassalia byssoidea]
MSAVLTPTTIAASNIGLIVAYICQRHLAKFSGWFNWASFCQYQHDPVCQSHRF